MIPCIDCGSCCSLGCIFWGLLSELAGIGCSIDRYGGAVIVVALVVFVGDN